MLAPCKAEQCVAGSVLIRQVLLIPALCVCSPYYGYGGCWGGCGYYGYRPYYGGGYGYNRGWGGGWGK